MRRETYGTSGTRIVVRFYQTWSTVLEQPTPRWSVQDCKADPSVNPACAPGEYLNTTIQERAWTSPIWFLP